MDGENNGYLCLNCNKTIKHKKNIGTHKKLCKQGQVTPFLVCDVCNEHFKFKSKFEIHKKIHTRTVFNCRSCDKNFKRSDHLERHDQQCSALQPPTMVDFVDNNSDQIVPDFTEFTQLADNNNDDIESFDAIVPEEPHEEVT